LPTFLYSEDHSTLFSAIRQDIVNNIPKEHRDNALQIKSMRDFDADWLKSFYEIISRYSDDGRGHNLTVDFGIAFKEPGGIQLILDIYSSKFAELKSRNLASSPTQSGRREAVAVKLKNSLLQDSGGAYSIERVIFRQLCYVKKRSQKGKLISTKKTQEVKAEVILGKYMKSSRK
jgi:hypothetical protein